MKRSSESEEFIERSEADPVLRRLMDDAAGHVVPEIAEPAQAFVAALAVGRISGRVWIVCPDVRRQEDFASEMAAWCSRVRLFPELEIPAGDALPDPETASERLELLRGLARAGGDEVVVIHRGQWDACVPSRAGLSRGVFRLEQGQQMEMET